MNRWIKLVLALSIFFNFSAATGQGLKRIVLVDYFGQILPLPVPVTLAAEISSNLSEQMLDHSLSALNAIDYQPLIDSLLAYRDKNKLNDWLYYQLIRRVAGALCAKEQNYGQYTLYKWYFMTKSGYDARLALAHQKIIFYIFNDEDIADIPFFMVDGKKYMCLNAHDYDRINLNDDPPKPLKLGIAGANKSFSYKVTRMPDFKPEDYINKKLDFVYDRKHYHFQIKLNKEIKGIFNNYPGVDFESYFNIPLSDGTYSSLIPLLRRNMSKMNQKKGVDYLMRFTRYAFLYEDDQQNFGKEKRMSPEETLSSAFSDCDDRAALFFYLVKEIYNLPMIALLYPTHITMAVEFNKPIGDSIKYKGKIYSVCEPTPELEDLAIGQMATHLKNVPYQIVYQYVPAQNP